MAVVSLEACLEQAEHAAALAHSDPAAARRMAEAVLDTEDVGPEARATALWACGLAARETEHLDEAHRYFGDAIEVADAAGLAARGARARLSWALVLVYRGDTDAAVAALEQARPHLVGVETGHCDLQQALVMLRLGRLDEALDLSLRALPVLREHGDRLAEARALNNLIVLHAYRSEFDEAIRAGSAARTIAEELGQTLLVARTVHNVAYALGRRGDVPTSLARYDEAEAAYHQLEDPDPYLAVLDADRAEVLLGVGLSDEARQRAEASCAALQRAENVTDLSEVYLLVARCRLAAGDAAGAVDAAEAAAGHFDEQLRPSWSAMARFIAIEATPVQDRSLGQRAADVAEQLDAAGWKSAAIQARVVAARGYLEAGDHDAAREVLGPPVADRRRSMTAAERAAVWHATALLRVVRGDRRGARRAVAAGLRVVDDHRATLGASELRAHAAAAGVDLARIGLRLAIEDDRPREALRWMESARAVSVLVPPARPPDDAALADELAQLRVVEAERRTASEPVRAGVLAARVRHLEAAVVRRTRRVAGGDRADGFRVADILDALGERALLEYAVLDGQFFGLLIAGGRVRLRPLGPVDAAEREIASLLFSLQRLSRVGSSPASLAAGVAAMEHSLGVLDSVLVGPFRRAIGDRPVVVVPSSGTRRMPWGSLPGLAGRPTSVAPSAAAWMRASTVRVPPLDRDVILVAGPGLDGAHAEITDLAALYPAATALTGPAATTNAVLGGLAAGAGVVHVAAHGTFRADNPLFSSLLLADGPLTVHDLSATGGSAAWFVLSACDAAVHASPTDDEILGMGAGLLSLGAANLVAPVCPVSDAATRTLMVSLHRRLLAGDRPAEALAALHIAAAAEPAERAAQVAFGVLGA